MKIVNRIIVFLAAAAVFPILALQNFVSIVLSIDRDSLVYTLINAISGKDNQLTNSRLGIDKTLVDLYNSATGKSESPFDFKEILANLPKEFDPLKKYIIAALVFVAVGVLIAIIIMGCALFTKAHRTVFALSLGGAASFITALVLFGKAAKPLLDGTIDVATTIMPLLMDSQSLLGSLASAALSGSISVDACGLGGAVYGAAIAMFALAMWEIAYYLTLPNDEKSAKKVKAK